MNKLIRDLALLIIVAPFVAIATFAWCWIVASLILNYLR